MRKNKVVFSSLRKNLHRIRKGLRTLKDMGPAYTLCRIRLRGDEVKSYRLWMKKPLYTQRELAAQRRRHFAKDITFSIIVPIYNSRESALGEMIASVIAQTYDRWQLCLADASDSNHAITEEICRQYEKQDDRICYCKLENNLGPSENTNVCLTHAAGDFIALLSQEDILHPAALYEMMEVICSENADLIYTDEAVFRDPDSRDIINIHYKPDYAPDNLRANNYIGHFTAFRRNLLEKTGGFRHEYDGCQDHDMMLRLTAVADRISHIPKVLYYGRTNPQSGTENTGIKSSASDMDARAVTESFRAEGIAAWAETTQYEGINRIVYEIKESPLVSIIIPSCDHLEDLDRCVRSIEKQTTWQNREIILVENNSKDPRTFAWYAQAEKEWNDLRVIYWNAPFNYSAVNNMAVCEAAEGDYVLLLNNDTEVITPGWIEEMLMYAQRPDVGAVGAMLYHPDDTIQHAGVILGMGGEGIAGHAFSGLPRGSYGYHGRLCYAQNLSAVTGACMMVRKNVWNSVGGLDEDFSIFFNDVDLCLRIRKAGYLIVWTPWAELYHSGSVSLGETEKKPEKKARHQADIQKFKERWRTELLTGDPYYNPNLTHVRTDYSLAWKAMERYRF